MVLAGGDPARRERWSAPAPARRDILNCRYGHAHGLTLKAHAGSRKADGSVQHRCFGSRLVTQRLPPQNSGQQDWRAAYLGPGLPWLLSCDDTGRSAASMLGLGSAYRQSLRRWRPKHNWSHQKRASWSIAPATVRRAPAPICAGRWPTKSAQVPKDCALSWVDLVAGSRTQSSLARWAMWLQSSPGHHALNDGPAMPSRTTVTTYTITPRSRRYWIEAISIGGARNPIERFDTEDGAVRLLREIQAQTGITNQWNSPLAPHIPYQRFSRRR
jgi:hypothetical protein